MWFPLDKSRLIAVHPSNFQVVTDSDTDMGGQLGLEI